LALHSVTRYKKATLGYNFGFSYKSNTEFYEDAEYGRYGLAGDPDVTEMEVREFQKGNFGVSSVLLSGLAGFAVKTLNAKYRINLMHLQNGESKAGIFDYIGSDQGSNFEGFQHNLEYSERGLTNLLIDGKHSFKGSDWDIIWKLSPTVSKIEDPDARFVRYIDENEVFLINTESGFPEGYGEIFQKLTWWALSMPAKVLTSMVQRQNLTSAGHILIRNVISLSISTRLISETYLLQAIRMNCSCLRTYGPIWVFPLQEEQHMKQTSSR